MILPRFIISKHRCLGPLAACLVLVFLPGCRTAGQGQSQRESRREVQEAMTAVAGALSGKQLTEEELRELERQLKTDAEARSAVEVITGSVGGQSPSVKYCPVCARRYAPNLELCPEHQAKLETVGSDDK